MLFNDKLKKIRQRSQLSQEQLAQKLVVSTATVSRIERGEQQPTFEFTALLVLELNIPAEILFTLDHELPNIKCFNKELESLDAAYEKLSMEDKVLFNNVFNQIVFGGRLCR